MYLVGLCIVLFVQFDVVRFDLYSHDTILTTLKVFLHTIIRLCSHQVQGHTFASFYDTLRLKYIQ